MKPSDFLEKSNKTHKHFFPIAFHLSNQKSVCFKYKKLIKECIVVYTKLQKVKKQNKKQTQKFKLIKQKRPGIIKKK